ncbi:MAG: hypothetical protein INQ03_03250 [Candidatus Heimdallarchaeota archaeon]|nr:hypothetical protein [Candidatus Heimdallarchaeota archaeon]
MLKKDLYQMLIQIFFITTVLTSISIVFYIWQVIDFNVFPFLLVSIILLGVSILLYRREKENIDKPTEQEKKSYSRILSEGKLQ